MITLISSIFWDRFNHRDVASAIRISLARSIALAIYNLPTISITSWFVICSHRPSDPRTINLSFGVKYLCVNSGSLLTPTDQATESPILRDIASPGICPADVQTRGGPNANPLTRIASTLPPDLLILSSSSGRSGLWSLLSYIAFQSPNSRCPSTIRESPTFATTNKFFLRTAVQHVLPLRETSKFPYYVSSAFVLAKDSFKDYSNSSVSLFVVIKIGSARDKFMGSCTFKKLLTWWPCSPCPSQIANMYWPFKRPRLVVITILS